MSDAGASSSMAEIDRVFREESGRILASLIRACGDFDLAEEALQEAFAAALERWPHDGVPDNPAAWITTTSRRKAIDRLRRSKVYREKIAVLEREFEEAPAAASDERETQGVEDDRLRLIFTCCHPALAPDAQI